MRQSGPLWGFASRNALNRLGNHLHGGWNAEEVGSGGCQFIASPGDLKLEVEVETIEMLVYDAWRTVSRDEVDDGDTEVRCYERYRTGTVSAKYWRSGMKPALRQA